MHPVQTRVNKAKRLMVPVFVQSDEQSAHAT